MTAYYDNLLISQLTSIWYQTNIMFACQFYNFHYIIVAACKETEYYFKNCMSS